MMASTKGAQFAAATEPEAMAEAVALAEQLGGAVPWFGTALIIDQVKINKGAA